MLVAAVNPGAGAAAHSHPVQVTSINPEFRSVVDPTPPILCIPNATQVPLCNLKPRLNIHNDIGLPPEGFSGGGRKTKPALRARPALSSVLAFLTAHHPKTLRTEPSGEAAGRSTPARNGGDCSRFVLPRFWAF